jgi:hypothetical protein
MDMKHYLMNVYKEHYGEHINEHLAKCIVKDMAITDGSDRENGEKYTMENAVEIGQKMGIDFDKIKKCEWYLVLNMMYSDYYRTASQYGHTDYKFFANLAQDWFHDEDGLKDKTFLYFFMD